MLPFLCFGTGLGDNNNVNNLALKKNHLFLSFGSGCFLPASRRQAGKRSFKMNPAGSGMAEYSGFAVAKGYLSLWVLGRRGRGQC
jgi:hypothetical protein